MPALLINSQQRKHLRALAHPLKAIVHVGQPGVTEGVTQAVDRALLDHELIKVQMLRPADKKGTAQELADSSGAALCGLLGHTVILYRPHPERPKLVLP